MSTSIELLDRNSVSFDSTALNGLRGISALHILFFHSFLYSEFNFDIYGAVSIYKEEIYIVHD